MKTQVVNSNTKNVIAEYESIIPLKEGDFLETNLHKYEVHYLTFKIDKELLIINVIEI